MSDNTITIKLRDTYKISPVISKIIPEEWEIILDYTGDLLSKHESLSNKFNDKSIKEALSVKYANQISALQLQTTAYETEIEELKNKMTGLTKAHKKELAQSIKEHRQNIEQEYQTMMEEKYNMLILTEQTKIAGKDTIINSLTERLQNLQSSIAQSYNTQINELQNKIEVYEKKYEEKCEEMSFRYQQQLDELRAKHRQQLDESVVNTKDSIKKHIECQYIDRLNKLQQDLADQENQFKLQKEYLVKTIEEKYESQITAHKQIEEQYEARLKYQEIMRTVSSKLDSLDTKLTPMLKHYGGSNNERGTSGENMIYNLLTTENTYLSAVVEDTSGQTARGDIMFSWRKLNCLIEVKNKKTLTKDDVDKFVRDVDSSVDSEYKINCAIFVSIDTDIIPGRTRDIIQLDFVRNIPVIYIYTPPPCKEIHYAIACLEKIINTRVSTNEQEKELQSHFKNYYNHIITYQKYFEKTIAAKRKEINALIKHLDVFNVLYDQLTPVNLAMNTEEEIDHASLQINDGDQNENTPVEQDDLINLEETVETEKELVGEPEEQYQQFVDAFIELSLNKNITPTITAICRYFNVSTSVITDLGGYKKITSDAKKQFTKTIITDAKAKLIMKYHSINGVFPPRQELVAHKILSDGSIRKLNKVIKTKRILDYINEYCSSLGLEISTEEVKKHKPDVEETKKKSATKKTTLPKKVPIDEPVEPTE
jgi:transcription elongation factor Elf1